MNAIHRTAAVVMLSFSLSTNAFAQWDIRGCADRGTNTAYPETIESTLWTFRSVVWDGYIDFQEEGRYWTHWGYGKWTVTPQGGLHLVNEYNGKSYDIFFTDSGFRYEGIRNDGLKISGRLICAQYKGPGPAVPEDVARDIVRNYEMLFARKPNAKELEAQFRLYNQGTSVDDLREGLKNTPEYKAILEKERANSTEQQLGW
jgi:hypothetical protein